VGSIPIARSNIPKASRAIDTTAEFGVGREWVENLFAPRSHAEAA
jgi:hypothetical protein